MVQMPKCPVLPNFISVEGIDGAGKTSLIQECILPTIKSFMETYFANSEVQAFDAWATEGAKKIRSLFVSHNYGDPMAELCLAFAARRDLWRTTLKPSLDNRFNVSVLDRWVGSSFAYQCRDNKAETAMLWGDLFLHTVEASLPGLTFYLDVPFSVGQDRLAIRQGKEKADRFEKEREDFFVGVADRFNTILRVYVSNGAEVIALNGDNPKEIVFKDCQEDVLRYLTKLYLPTSTQEAVTKTGP